MVSRRQLESVGATRSALSVRLASRRLLRIHPGVYAVGHRRLTRAGEWLAAVLAAGPGAVLSHHSAAALHGLRAERGRRVDVSTAAKRATTNWIELHGRRTLDVGDVGVVRRIPVTTISRTLVDLADVLGPRQLARAINEADVMRRLDLGAIDAALARLHGRRGRGHAVLRAALDDHHGPTLLRSELEIRFKELVVLHALPRPEHNVGIEGWEADACWRSRRLIVELDSRFHDTPAARRKDARKDEALRGAGWEVLRYRWRDVVDAPTRVAEELRRRLAT